MIAAILGSRGFIGSAIVAACGGVDVTTRSVLAPRLRCEARDLAGLMRESIDPSLIGSLAERIRGADVVINAAGLAGATSRDSSAMVGANSLLPRLIAEAARQAGVPRLVHVSSAAVLGDRILDESRATAPFSAYSLSKALGERALDARDSVEVVAFRPTSVHGPSRAVSTSLGRLARSNLASVAGSGARPSPQVLVENVASAIAFTATHAGPVPAVVLQPWEGLTCAGVLRALGGKEPRHLPEPVARAAVRALRGAERLHESGPGLRRRVEMLWWGQRQRSGWLTQAGWQPPLGVSKWLELGTALKQRGST